MFGFTRDQWTNWIMGALMTFLAGRALQWLSITLGGMDWTAGVSALANPNVQAWIGEILLPIVMLAIYLPGHKGKWSFEPIAKITICSMSCAYLLVFALNLGRPNNVLIAQLVEDPISAFPLFFVPIFYLMHSVLRTIVENRA